VARRVGDNLADALDGSLRGRAGRDKADGPHRHAGVPTHTPSSSSPRRTSNCRFVGLSWLTELTGLTEFSPLFLIASAFFSPPSPGLNPKQIGKPG
jgi:hypothetical protein